MAFSRPERAASQEGSQRPRIPVEGNTSVDTSPAVAARPQGGPGVPITDGVAPRQGAGQEEVVEGVCKSKEDNTGGDNGPVDANDAGAWKHTLAACQ